MIEILTLGFLLGMRHTLEADHVAAVATLAARDSDPRRAALQGAVWGAGHTASLFLACSAVLFLDTVVPARLAHGLEAAVGIMLIGLGADVVRRLLRDRVHFHVHSHADGTVHFHAHSHTGDGRAHTDRHEHVHAAGFPRRALYIGMMHGLAGSAALILLTLSSVASPLTGLLYIGVFGIGSVAGMALLSLAISVPLRSTRHFTWLHNGLQTAVGLSTLYIGGVLVYESLGPTVA